MATQFSEIYDLASPIKTDTRLANKPNYLVERYKYECLIFSISEFVKDCYQDISKKNRVNYEDKEYTFNGVVGQTSFILDTPPQDTTGIYVKINDDSVNYTYSYDDVVGILTISPALTKNTQVFVAPYKTGYFIADLNDTETVILAEGMIIPFLEEQRNKNELLNQMVYNSDGKIYSQANHIQILNDAIIQQYERIVRPKIRKYSFDYAPNRLMSLAGRPNYTVEGTAYSWQ